MSRWIPIHVWLAASVPIVVAGVALGVSVTAGTAAMLLTLSLAPIAIVLLLWPRIQPETAADVLHGRDGRG